METYWSMQVDMDNQGKPIPTMAQIIFWPKLSK